MRSIDVNFLYIRKDRNGARLWFYIGIARNDIIGKTIVSRQCFQTRDISDDRSVGIYLHKNFLRSTFSEHPQLMTTGLERDRKILLKR